MMPEFDGDFDVIGFMKNINRLMFQEEMMKIGIKPIKLKPLSKPETPLWMKYPKCSCCGNYIIVKPKMVDVMKEAGITSKDLCISCLYRKSQNIAAKFFSNRKQEIDI